MRRDRRHFSSRFNQTEVTVRKCDPIRGRNHDSYTLTRQQQSAPTTSAAGLSGRLQMFI